MKYFWKNNKINGKNLKCLDIGSNEQSMIVVKKNDSDKTIYLCNWNIQTMWIDESIWSLTLYSTRKKKQFLP